MRSQSGWGRVQITQGLASYSGGVGFYSERSREPLQGSELRSDWMYFAF